MQSAPHTLQPLFTVIQQAVVFVNFCAFTLPVTCSGQRALVPLVHTVLHPAVLHPAVPSQCPAVYVLHLHLSVQVCCKRPVLLLPVHACMHDVGHAHACMEPWPCLHTRPKSSQPMAHPSFHPPPIRWPHASTSAPLPARTAHPHPPTQACASAPLPLEG